MKFRENFKLKKEYQNDDYYQAAYEYACENKLYPNEINVIGKVIELKKEEEKIISSLHDSSIS